MLHKHLLSGDSGESMYRRSMKLVGQTITYRPYQHREIEQIKFASKYCAEIRKQK